MDRDVPNANSHFPRSVLSQADQLTVVVLVGTALFAILLHWSLSLAFEEGLVEFDERPQPEHSFQVQLNQADWPELMLLPRIGEILARRIVAYRQEHGPFENLQQLQDVNGIGPKTVRRLRPYVRFDSEELK